MNALEASDELRAINDRIYALDIAIAQIAYDHSYESRLLDEMKAELGKRKDELEHRLKGLLL